MADTIFNSSFVKQKIKKDGREQNDGVMGGVPKPASPLRDGGETREDFFLPPGPESLGHCIDFLLLFL